jgi:hypothetical protein
MVTRDFDAMLAEKAGIRPTFKIGGQIFTLRAKLPYARWTKLLAAMRDDDVSGEQANEQFFRAVLIPGDRDRFMALLESEADDDGAIIGVEDMDGLLDWAMAHFTGKAPSSSNGSSPGSSETGQRPNVISLSSKAPANAS